MLIGTWSVALDGDALALPPAFRRAAAAGLTVTRGFDRCLQAFPNDSWQALAARVSSLPLTADAARSLRRMLFGAAVSLSPDPLGAITLPRRLLAFAEIGPLAVLLGCDTYFEIWSPAALGAASPGAPAPERIAALVAGPGPARPPALM